MTLQEWHQKALDREIPGLVKISSVLTKVIVIYSLVGIVVVAAGAIDITFNSEYPLGMFGFYYGLSALFFLPLIFLGTVFNILVSWRFRIKWMLYTNLVLFVLYGLWILTEKDFL